MTLPNPHPHREHSLSAYLRAWAEDERSLADLLSLSSNESDPVEPPWLSLCEYLVNPRLLGEHPLSQDADHRRLEKLRVRLWGKDAGEASMLASSLFSLDAYDSKVPRETAWRALAMAEWARECQDYPSKRQKPWNNPVQSQLHPLEQVLLRRHWLRIEDRLIESRALALPVLLVHNFAALEERGRLCRLRLWKVDVSGFPEAKAWHGAVVRAPAAMLLTLKGRTQTGEVDDSFERALRKVEVLLRSCLNPPDEHGQGAWALAWSLQPIAMAHERADGRQQPVYWGMDAITGGSASLPFALGSLKSLAPALRTDGAHGLLLLRKQLRAIDPVQLAMTAAFAGEEPPAGTHPLDWPLEPIAGLKYKLRAFVLFNQSRTPGARSGLALVADGQTGSAEDGLQREEAKTLREAIAIAERFSQAALPEPAERALNALLQHAHGLQQPVASDAPQSPRLSTDLLRALRTTPASPDWPVGEHRAVQFHLLQRYARWAGGEHLLWGEPAQLASDFAPIELEPERRTRRGKPEAEDDDAETEPTKARSLFDLLQRGEQGFVQPRVWVLTAAPAAGKSTLLAEYEMHMAWRALSHHAASADDSFGEVPIWVPARSLKLGRDKEGQLLPLGQAIAAYLRQQHPALGTWPELLHSPGLQPRLMLDGANELDCRNEERQTLLGQWLDHDYPQGHRHLPPLITVRTLEKSFVFDGDRQAKLLPWAAGQREHYIRQRLEKGHPELLQPMLDAVEQDSKSVGHDPGRMLYSSPGMLALGCTLMEQGLLPVKSLDTAAGHSLHFYIVQAQLVNSTQGSRVAFSLDAASRQPVNRARLLATFVWAALRREWAAKRIHVELLGDEELERLPKLEEDLRCHRWALPKEPGPLLQALGRQARYMNPRVQQRRSGWFKAEASKSALIRAAIHLNLIGEADGGDADARGQWEAALRWTHHLLLEWFAAYGLTPDALPEGVAAPKMESIELQFQKWQEASSNWLVRMERISEALAAGEAIDYEELSNHHWTFRLGNPPVSVHEEAIRFASQLRGRLDDWVVKLIKAGNVPLAARVALENWSVFGEPLYPQEDPLGPWRAPRRDDPDGEELTTGTHPVLNQLRAALHARMYSEATHIDQRIEAGNLLGLIGGSPLYRICGNALVLREDHWVQIGEPGGSIDFEMGDLLGDDDERTEQGTLYRVKGLPAFRMAKLLITNAQYRCFAQCQDFVDPAWWPGDAGVWWRGCAELRRGDRGMQDSRDDGYGLSPVCCNFWQAQAYCLWELAQRRAAGEVSGDELLNLPTEAQWEGGARWAAYLQDRGGQSGPNRWRFAHTQGTTAPANVTALSKDQTKQASFTDVNCWDFNYDSIVDNDLSPVGVFLEGSGRLQVEVPRDLAGNASEWTRSESSKWLDHRVMEAAEGDKIRVLRGGSYDLKAAQCRAGDRDGDAPYSFDLVCGFRLVFQSNS